MPLSPPAAPAALGPTPAVSRPRTCGLRVFLLRAPDRSRFPPQLLRLWARREDGSPLDFTVSAGRGAPRPPSISSDPRSCAPSQTPGQCCQPLAAHLHRVGSQELHTQSVPTQAGLLPQQPVQTRPPSRLTSCGVCGSFGVAFSGCGPRSLLRTPCRVPLPVPLPVPRAARRAPRLPCSVGTAFGTESWPLPPVPPHRSPCGLSGARL